MAALTLSQVRAALDANKLPYLTLALPDGCTLLVMQRGARIYGPFLPTGESLCWINPAFASADTLREFLERGEWNAGGERIWIAPEIQFNVPERERFWETHHVQSQMDPAKYTQKQTAAGITLHSTMALHAYNLAQGTVLLDVDHLIRLQPRNPLYNLRDVGALMDGVTYAGWSRRVDLERLAGDGIGAEAWCLLQLLPDGTLYIPTTAQDTEVATYFGDVLPDALTPVDGAFRIQLTGRQQYKTGYAAVNMTGRMAYLYPLGDNNGALLVRSYFNDPSNPYSEEPPDAPGRNGYSVHVYNGDGSYGINGEMEANGRNVSVDGAVSDTFTLWLYRGSLDKLKSIGRVLLGIEL